MKKQGLIFTGIMVISMISINFSERKSVFSDEATKLMDAEKTMLVKSDIISKGDYSGDCINMTLTNLKKIPQKILVPAGTVFISDISEEQNILVTRDVFCQLRPGESKVFDLSGYCCEMHDAAPGEGSVFKVSMHTDEKIQKLVNFLKDKEYDDGTIQSAVWTVANGASVSAIYNDDETKLKELKKFVCGLTGQKETWYSARQNYQLDENRRIRAEPVEIKGMLTCTIDKPTEVINEIYDSGDNLLYTPGEPMLFPKKGNYTYEFKIKVEGWDKGKYYVLVKGGNKKLLKQEFDI